jgi:hypothetical protein
MTDLNPIFKAQWVAALRSAAYNQTSGQLKHGNAYCCLGVACDISKLGKWDEDTYTIGDIYTGYSNGEWEAEGSLLPKNIALEIGLETNPKLPIKPLDWVQPKFLEEPVTPFVTLAKLNDDGFPFDQIADLVEYFL